MTVRVVVVTAHWRARVLERLGRGVDADALAEAIAWEIDKEGCNVQYLGRVSRDGKRVYRFAFPKDLGGAALVKTDEVQIRFITLYESGWRISREGKKSVHA